MTKALVPSNHRRREHALAEVLAPIRAIDTRPIEWVWDAWRCPAPLLPILAYALSVDFWDDNWDEVRRRRAIAESPAYHRRKGTRAAVETAAGYTARAFTIIEWWQFSPPARRGTFAVTLHLNDAEPVMPAPEQALLRHLITRAKPKSRAFTLLAGHVEALSFAVGVGLLGGGGAVLAVPPDDLELEFSPHVWVQPGSGAPLEVQ